MLSPFRKNAFFYFFYITSFVLNSQSILYIFVKYLNILFLFYIYTQNPSAM